MSDPKKKQAGPPGKLPIDLHSAIRERILSRDSRYTREAYLFIYEALAFTQKRLGRDDPELDAAQRHVSGGELLAGIRDYAAEIFGPLAPTVFREWGVRRTQDFGELVFNLVEHDLLGKTEEDHREDFADGFDFDTAFDESFDVDLQ